LPMKTWWLYFVSNNRTMWQTCQFLTQNQRKQKFKKYPQYHMSWLDSRVISSKHISWTHMARHLHNLQPCQFSGIYSKPHRILKPPTSILDLKVTASIHSKTWLFCKKTFAFTWSWLLDIWSCTLNSHSSLTETPSKIYANEHENLTTLSRWLSTVGSRTTWCPNEILCCFSLVSTVQRQFSITVEQLLFVLAVQIFLIVLWLNI
jgi:hypothetical protein